jgi:hypothetical protein
VLSWKRSSLAGKGVAALSEVLQTNRQPLAVALYQHDGVGRERTTGGWMASSRYTPMSPPAVGPRIAWTRWSCFLERDRICVLLEF